MEHDWTAPVDLTEEDWRIVHTNYLMASEVLDTFVDVIRRHIEDEEGTCTGPWCAPKEFIAEAEKLTDSQAWMLFHMATYRLALLTAEVKINEDKT